ncbi:MAG: NAD(P)-dependent oxidoreductase [Chloroflexota bacterium]
MRVAVTGAGGRLGQALIAALADAPFTGLAGPIAWTRSDYDLDDPDAAARLVGRDRPELVVHAAAWTDVDGCARQPDLAMRRNAAATSELARACASAEVDLVAVSTNEVFDGTRGDGLGYRPDDPTAPPNAYGASKLAGEAAAREAFEAPARAALAIARTAWLYGPPGNDFPTKILAAAERARSAGEPLSLVADEFGSPTSASDLAEAIVELVGAGSIAGTWHLANLGAVSRAEWAREVLRLVGLSVATVDVPASTWPRPSTPPRWGVLEPSRLPSGDRMRPWIEALADDVPRLRRAVAAATAGVSASTDGESP